MSQPQPVSRTVPNPPATTPFSDPSLDRLRKAIRLENGRPVLPSGMTISERERQRISVLATGYRDQLSPGRDNRKHLAVILAKLLAAFPAPQAGETSTDLRIAAYLEAVETIPAWAVDAARGAIVRGETECDTRFAPTPPQLARIARKAMAPMYETAVELDRIVQAVERLEPGEEERARVSAGLAALYRELGGTGPGDAAASAQARFAEMCAEAGVDPESIKDAPDRGTFRRMG